MKITNFIFSIYIQFMIFLVINVFILILILVKILVLLIIYSCTLHLASITLPIITYVNSFF